MTCRPSRLSRTPPARKRARCTTWLVAGVAACALCLTWGAPRVQARPDDDDDAPWAKSSADDITIELVTFGPGDEIYNYFGHNAMIVRDRKTDEARLYNYGMFHFGPEMLPSYMKGRLTFWVGDGPVQPTYERYIEMNRSIRVQELNLAPEQRLRLAHTLQDAVLPKNRDYLYHHYFNNCSTKLRDLIDMAINGQFKQALQPAARMSYREHTRRYASKDPVVDFALIFWMNDMMEAPIKRWDETFLPEELEHQVATMKYVNAAGERVPLVATAFTIYEARRAPTPARASATWPTLLALGALFGALVVLTARALARAQLARRRWLRVLFGVEHAVLGLALGLPGLLGFLMWTLTEHVVTYRNENQLLANPLTFALLPLGIALAFGSKRALGVARYCCYALAATSLALIVLKLLPAFDQDTRLPMALLTPMNLSFALAHRLLAPASDAPSAPTLAAAGPLAGEPRA